jgi:hypothetical protein
VYPSSLALLWCVRFWFCLGPSRCCPEEFHLGYLYFAFLSLRACPQLRSN